MLERGIFNSLEASPALAYSIPVSMQITGFLFPLYIIITNYSFSVKLIPSLLNKMMLFLILLFLL